MAYANPSRPPTFQEMQTSWGRRSIRLLKPLDSLFPMAAEESLANYDREQKNFAIQLTCGDISFEMETFTNSSRNYVII
jgi:hypothetical protein